jgi:hypothetical protein
MKLNEPVLLDKKNIKAFLKPFVFIAFFAGRVRKINRQQTFLIPSIKMLVTPRMIC